MLVRASLALALLAAAAAAPHAQTYVRVLDLPGAPSVHDLDWRDGVLWATDTNPDRVLQIDPQTGAVTVQAALPFDPRGLAWDGAAFRISTGFDTSSPVIQTVSPDGTVTGSVPAPSALTNGLTVHDGLLWAANAYPDAGASIVGLDPATGAVVETVPFPSTQPTGLAFLGDGTLWASNAGDDSGSSGVYTLFHLDRATGAVLGTLDVPPGTTRPRGLAYDGSRYLYVAVREGTAQTPRLYVADLQQSGNAVAVVAPDSLDFGSVAIGGERTLPLSVGNAGDAPLVVSNVSFAWTLVGDSYGSTTLAAQSIAPGATVAATVTFHADTQWPVAGGGWLQFETNDVNRPVVTIPIRGQSAFAGPVASVPSAHDFGPVAVDPGARQVAVWPLPVTNQGTEALTVTGVTTADPAFAVYDAADLPLTLAPGASGTVRLAFRPAAVQAYSTTARVEGTAAVAPTIALTGSGVAPGDPAAGTLAWRHDVPANAATSSSDRKVFALAAPGDLTGDGRTDLVYAARPYWTRALDAGSLAAPPLPSGPAELWAFSSCPSNDNCGNVSSGSGQLYETGIGWADLSGDGTPDVVVGTEGGNDHVYALDGRTGAVLWSVGSDADPFLASYTSVSLRPGLDATGDGVPDVATGTGSASPESPNPVNHRRTYLLSGADGQVVWSRSQLFPAFRTVLYRATDGLRVASAGGENSAGGLQAWRAADGGLAFSVAPAFSPFLAEPLPSAACAGCEDLLVAGLGATVERRSGETGAVVWAAGVGGSSVWDVAVVPRAGLAPLVAVGGTGSDVRALDGLTGAAVWQAALPDQVFAVEAAPDGDRDGVDDVVAAGKGGVAVWLSGATGQERWRYVFGDGQFATSGEDVTPVGDLDGDGAPEVAVGTRDGRVLLLYGYALPVSAGAPVAAGDALRLDAPFPNPSAGAVTLRYRLAAGATVRLSVLDALGRTVWAAADAEQAPGSYALDVPTRLAAGVYTVRAEAGGTVRTQRLSVVR